nr:GcrA family cell cycle regulator [Aminobacter niigataensis]
MTPAQRLEAVRQLLEQGHAPSAIAWKFQARPAAIATVVKAIRKADGAPQDESPPVAADLTQRAWAILTSEERDAVVLALRADGLAASAIAAQLATTRNAVIGYMKRLTDAGVEVPGLKKPMRPRTSRVPTPPSPSKKQATPKPAKAPAPKRDKVLRRSAAGAVEAVPMRGPNNPHPYDFKARAEQRASSPGLSPALVAGEPIRAIEDLAAPVSRRLALTQLTERTCKWPNGDPQAEDFGFCGHQVSSAPYCAYHARIAYVPPTIRHRADIRSAERKFA